MRGCIKRPIGLIAAVTLVLSGSPALAHAQETDELVPFADAQLADCASKAAGSLKQVDLGKVTKLSCEFKGEGRHVVSDFAGLGALTKLTKLSFKGFDFARPGEGASEAELTAALLPEFKELQSLTFDDSAQLPGDLIGYPKLTELNLTNGSFSELPSLVDLPRLRVVDFTGSSIDPAKVQLPNGVYSYGLKAVASPKPSFSAYSAGSETTGSAVAQPTGMQPVFGQPREAKPTPGDEEMIPDGQLKGCVGYSWNENSKKYKRTKNQTRLELKAGCAGTKKLDNWTGVEWLPNVEQITFEGFTDGLVLPADGLFTVFPKLKSIIFSKMGYTSWPNIGSSDKVTELHLNNDPYSSLELKADFPNLQQLSIYNTEIKALPSFATGVQLAKLTDLSVNTSKITDLKGLDKYTSLVNLTLSSSELASIADAKSATLQRLEIAKSKLASLKGLNQLTALTELEVKDSAVTNLTGAVSSTLKEAELNNNKITTLEGISGLTALKSLDVGGNELTSLPNDGNSTITNLSARRNKLVDLNGLEKFPALTKLSASNNALRDLSALDKFDEPKAIEVTAQSQKIAYPDIVAGEAQDLTKVLTEPTKISQKVEWEADKGNMPAVNAAKGKFTAVKAGDWKMKFNVWSSSYSFSGEVTGKATGDKEIVFKLVMPNPAPVDGEEGTYKVDYSGIAGEITWQWYLKTSSWDNSPKLVAGADSSVYVNSSVDAEDAGKFYLVKATTDGGVFQTETQEIQVRPKIQDPGVAKCLRNHFSSDNYTIADMEDIRKLDCSATGVVDTVDFGIYQSAFSKLEELNLSHNSIPYFNAGDLVKKKYSSLEFIAKKIDLSYNQISRVSNFKSSVLGGQIDMASSWSAPSINLEHNQITDISDLLTHEMPTGSNIVLNIKNQDINLKATTINTDQTLPKLNDPRSDEPVAITPDAGAAVEDGVANYSTKGLHKLTWQTADGQGVAFSGSFNTEVVGSLDELKPSLTIEPAEPVAGHPVTVKMRNFDSRTLVKLKLDGKEIKMGPFPTDMSGAAEYVLIFGYDQTGPHKLAADMSPEAVTIDFTVKQDEQIVIPDESLKSCILTSLKLNDAVDKSLYKSRIAKMNTTLTCSNAKVKSLEGIGQTPVTKLNIGGNEINDFSPLSAIKGQLSNVSGIGQKHTVLGITNTPIPAVTFTAADFGTLTKVGPYDVKAAELPKDDPGYIDRNDESKWAEYATTENGKTTWHKGGHFRTVYTWKSESPNVTVTFWADAYIGVRPAPAVKMAPEAVLPNQPMSVVVVGFNPHEKVLLTTNPGNLVMGYAKADEYGVVEFKDLKSPYNLLPGIYKLHALGLSSGLKAESTGRIVIQRHSVAVNPSQVYPGQLMNIGAAGFAPGEKVRFELHSDPLVLGVAEADVNGVARLNNVMLDKAVKAGVHEVVAYGETTGYEVDVPVMVKQLPPQQNNLNKVNQSQPGARGAQFKGRAPKTGETNNLAPYALLSVFAAGCLLISRNRRKEQN